METAHHVQMDKARSLILQYGWNSIAYQILNPGISLWFNEDQTSVVGYVETSTHLIAAGGPICEDELLTSSVRSFKQFASARNKRLCLFGAQERIAAILNRFSPISTILLGAQPVWQPQTLLKNIQAKSSLRAQLSRAVNKGVRIEQWNSSQSQGNPELLRCLHEWLNARRLPAMHFLVEPFTLNFMTDRLICVALRYDTVIGFCVASPIPLRNGWLIEQIIRGKNAPNGTAELLLHEMVTTIQVRQASLVTLGLSPLSQFVAPNPDQPRWLTMTLKITRRWGSFFYNFEGLEAFKAKFLPEQWEPIYAITNEKYASPSTLYAIATAFSGMSPVRFIANGIRKAIL